ncbi:MULTISPECIES: RES family NAD+ phosphorylase [Oleiagrimonas]|nr:MULTISPECIES: RES family NAD+ phosphorylase [Oleiagrimonas]
MDEPPKKRVRWTHAYRIVSSRFPPVGAFDRIAEPGDLEALYAIEAMTNPRLRQELGELSLVPESRRISGPGSTPVMAAFTHLNPEGSRFSDGSYGVFYAAHRVATAIEETVYHRECFLAATREPPIHLQMRCYRTSISATLHDLRGGWPKAHDPDDYGYGQALGRRLRRHGSNGIVYDSVRDVGSQCVAAFYPDVVAPCVQAGHYIYRWDGTRISAVLEVASVTQRVDGSSAKP